LHRIRRPLGMVDFRIRTSPDGSEMYFSVLEERREARTATDKITDDEAARALQKARFDMPRHRVRLGLSFGTPVRLAKISLPHHSLGDRAVRALVEALVMGTVLVRDLELYDNMLGDASAQAIAKLIEHSPAGIHGLHLSHNYMSCAAIGLMLRAAAHSRAYPLKSEIGAGAPLWLRVENQHLLWPELNFRNIKDKELMQAKAEKIVDDQCKKIVSSLQDRGVLPRDPGPEFKLACIPKEWSYTERCSKNNCCHATEHGPIVHLPYFWQQKGERAEPPSTAQLRSTDADWMTWRPRLPRNTARPAQPDALEAKIADVPEASRLEDASDEDPSTNEVEEATAAVSLPIASPRRAPAKQVKIEVGKDVVVPADSIRERATHSSRLCSPITAPTASRDADKEDEGRGFGPSSGRRPLAELADTSVKRQKVEVPRSEAACGVSLETAATARPLAVVAGAKRRTVFAAKLGGSGGATLDIE